MMMFDSQDELVRFIAKLHSDWTITDGRIFFNSNVQMRSQQIPGVRLISENLIYATELERIV
jgi:26S proteasome regulatory subunit N12